VDGKSLIRILDFSRPPSYSYVGPTVFGQPQNRFVTDLGERLSQTLLFRPWVYLVAIALWTLVAWRRQHPNRVFVYVLTTSALLYTLPFAVVGVSADFRYLWWPVLVSLVQPVVLAGRRRSVAPDASESA